MRKLKSSINSFIRGAAMICCAAAFLFSLTAQGQTKPEMIDDFSQTVKENPKVTYADLIDLVFPETGANERKSIPLDNIFGDYKAKVYEGNLQISYARAAWVNVNGRQQLLLLINLSGHGNEDFLWQEMNVLALFETESKPKLINAVDVQGDRLAFFSEQQPILNINPQTDAFLMVNHHFNAGESFTNLTLVGVVNNRLKIVLGDLPTLKIENRCGISSEYKAALTVVTKSRKPYRNITVNLKYSSIPDGEECGRKVRGSTKQYRYHYTWDEKRSRYARVRQ